MGTGLCVCLSMCRYVDTCMYACGYVCVRIDVYAWNAHNCVCVCRWTWILTDVCPPVGRHIWAGMFLHVHVYMCACIYVHSIYMYLVQQNDQILAVSYGSMHLVIKNIFEAIYNKRHIYTGHGNTKANSKTKLGSTPGYTPKKNEKQMSTQRFINNNGWWVNLLQ